MMATLMPMPAMRTRSAAPCAPIPGATAVATARDTYVTTTSNRWLGVLGSFVRQTDTFGTKRHDPDVLTGGLT